MLKLIVVLSLSCFIINAKLTDKTQIEANHHTSLIGQGYTLGKTQMGDISYTKMVSHTEKHSIVYFKDWNTLSTQLIQRWTDRIATGKRLSYNLEAINCEWGEGPDYWRFLPAFKGAAFINGPAISFSNHCWQQGSAQITNSSSTSITLTLNVAQASSFDCYDTFLIAILDQYHIDKVEFHGKVSVTFNNLTPNDIYDINQNGVRVFTFCDDISTLVEDIAMTAELFSGGFTTDKWLPVIGSHVTWWMEKANINFLQQAINYTMEKRPNTAQTLQKEDIQSGSFLAVTRLDGLDEIIMWGCGSRVGHSTVAVWVTENGVRDLYIMESQAGWYWPRTGIQMNQFDQWVKWANDASFNVVVLPLLPAVQANFNETAAYEWFKTVEGMPYGFHNFAFGWIDTPTQNFPAMLDPNFLFPAVQTVYKIMPEAINSVFLLSLNKHAGTVNLTLPELEVAVGAKNMTLLDLAAVVEEEGWMYPDGYAYVCSSFVLGLYKRAGILGDLTLQATEFTPRDVYSLNIFDPNPPIPQQCKTQDPDIPYCQLIGKYRVNLGTDYASIAPYNNMDQVCPSIAPTFYRPDGC